MDQFVSGTLAAVGLGLATFFIFMLLFTVFFQGGGRTELHVWCDTKGAQINWKTTDHGKLTTVWCLKNGKRVP